MQWYHSNRKINMDCLKPANCMSAEEAGVAMSQSEDVFLFAKKNLPPEAQRISDAMENCIRQVEIAATLPAILQFYSVSGVVDEDLSRLLRAHQTLQERLEKLEGLQPKSDGEQPRQTEEVRRRKTVQLKTSIKNSVRDVLRFFRKHPDVFRSLRMEMDVELGESESTLIRTLKMFHKSLVEKLLSGHDEDPHQVLANQLSSSSAQSLDELISQEKEGAAILKELDEEILKKDSEIKNLKQTSERVAEEKEKPNQPKKVTSSTDLTPLNQEIGHLKAQLSDMILENEKEERKLQEKTETLEKEIEQELQDFDKKMEENQAKLELMEEDYRRVEEELKQLQEPFSLLQETHDHIQERRRLEQEKEMEERRKLLLKTKAAKIIQTWWRQYRSEKVLNDKKKSTKAKKGKSKKTK